MVQQPNGVSGIATEALLVESSGGARILRDVIDSMAEGVIVADIHGRFVLFNASAERILSIGLIDVPLEEWSAVYGCYRPDMVTLFPAEQLPLARSLRGEIVDECEIYIRRQGATSGKWITVGSRPVTDRNGQIVGGVATFRDNSGNRQQLEHIQLLSKIVEETADGVLLTNASGRIEYVNPAFERLTGFSREELLGQNPRILKSGLHSRDFYEDLWSTLLRGDVYRGAITDRRKNGELYESSQTITALRSADGTISHLACMVRDETERLKMAARQYGLDLARQVQQRLFPTSPPQMRGLDVCGVCIPADTVGGDYFDYLMLPGGSLGVVICDVSGHGLDSAILMAQTRALVRGAARVEADPGRILSAVNTLLFPDMGGSGFVGLVVVDLDPRTRVIRYANAGHASAYVLDNSGAVKAELSSTGTILGAFPDVVIETVQAPDLEIGDLIVMFTDGVTETSAPGGRMVGAQWALDVVRSSAHRSSREILEVLCGAIRDLSAGTQVDDITVVVCRVEQLG